jgi:hypothetical protein
VIVSFLDATSVSLREAWPNFTFERTAGSQRSPRPLNVALRPGIAYQTVELSKA